MNKLYPEIIALTDIWTPLPFNTKQANLLLKQPYKPTPCAKVHYSAPANQDRVKFDSNAFIAVDIPDLQPPPYTTFAANDMSFEHRSNIKSRAQSASIDSFSSFIASTYDPTTYEGNDEVTTNSEMIFDALKSPSSKHVTFKSQPVPNAFAGLTTVSKKEKSGAISATTGKSTIKQSSDPNSHSKKPTKRASPKKDNSSKSNNSSKHTKPSHGDDDDPSSPSSSSVSSGPTFSKKKHKRKRNQNTNRRIMIPHLLLFLIIHIQMTRRIMKNSTKIKF